jgi:hypothetical protein
LLELGYADGMAAREQILHLIGRDELLAAQGPEPAAANITEKSPL